MRIRLFLPALLTLLPTALPAAIFQGNGIKLGEVTADSAVIWTRLTTSSQKERCAARSSMKMEGLMQKVVNPSSIWRGIS